MLKVRMKSSPRIAFFGTDRAMNYHQVGGTNSLVRRLASWLAESGFVAAADYVLYGCASSYREEHSPTLGSVYCRTITEAFAILEKYDHVVTLYVLPRDRVRFALFRRRLGRHIAFHIIYPSWPESRWKRWLMFADTRLAPLTGCAFGVSLRLVSRLSRWNRRSALLLPPVPAHYFLRREEKPLRDRLSVCYIGRLDNGKGVPEALELFDALSDTNGLRLTVCGLHWPHDPTSNATHARLVADRRLRYVQVPWESDWRMAEALVGQLLREADILVQPYRTLSSTIDTPLLVLEAMASLVAVITKPYGNIPDVYGMGRCLVRPARWVSVAEELVRTAAEWLPAEVDRLAERREELSFDVASVGTHFARCAGLDGRPSAQTIHWGRGAMS